MQLDVQTYGHDLTDVGAAARDAEARGFASWLASETTHDPVLACGVAALATERIAVGTAIAVAFARDPMLLAYQAQDVQRALGDRRLLLGLGSQIKPHVTRRFSQPWPDRPAAAMREYIGALHAIWDCWEDGQPLDFRGERHRHDLMTPMFTPEPTGVRPAVWLAAVGPGMTRVAGEVADGLLCHTFTTPAYLRDTTLPAVAEGIARVEGRTRGDVQVAMPVMVVTGYHDGQREATRRQALQQIGFYGSTPAYRPVLEAHGWGDLGEELTRLSKADGWARMAASIPEEVLDAFAVTCEPDEVGAAVVERVGGLLDRVVLPDALPLEPRHVRAAAEALASA